MARAATVRRETPQAPQYRTGPQRRESGFQPAQRVTIPPPRGSREQERFFREPEREEVMEEEREQEVEQEEPRGYQPRGGPITKSGYPDRRFKGQRDLPPPPDEPRGVRARVGGTIGDMHVTISGKPDRRFKENRALSEEELTQRWLDTLNEEYGRK